MDTISERDDERIHSAGGNIHDQSINKRTNLTNLTVKHFNSTQEKLRNKIANNKKAELSKTIGEE